MLDTISSALVTGSLHLSQRASEVFELWGSLGPFEDAIETGLQAKKLSKGNADAARLLPYIPGKFWDKGGKSPVAPLEARGIVGLV